MKKRPYLIISLSILALALIAFLVLWLLGVFGFSSVANVGKSPLVGIGTSLLAVTPETPHVDWVYFPESVMEVAVGVGSGNDAPYNFDAVAYDESYPGVILYIAETIDLATGIAAHCNSGADFKACAAAGSPKGAWHVVKGAWTRVQ